MSSQVKIDGKSYEVVENMGFSHNTGQYAKFVKDGDKERVAVRYPGGMWRFDRSNIIIGNIIRGQGI